MIESDLLLADQRDKIMSTQARVVLLEPFSLSYSNFPLVLLGYY